MNTTDKYYWIVDHPKLTSKWVTQASIELTPHMVNPENNTVECDAALNTKQQWWVEVSSAAEDFDPETDHHAYCHDWELDTGGDTPEEAINNLYNLVIKHYGDY